MEDETTFASCGRQNASSGTEGKVSHYDGDTRIMKVGWKCPRGTGSNELKTHNVEKGWFPAVSNYSTSGALGEVSINVFNR
jgi:hypothetical protein